MLKKRELKKEQDKLATKIIIQDIFSEINTIGGVDVSYIGDLVISGIIVFDIKSKKILDRKYASVKTSVPYAPGYVSYREAPSIAEAFQKLNTKPDILMIDGNGILHQRRFGCASHVGIILDIPTIGVSKSLALGEITGDTVYVEKEARAKILATKEHANPIYVSPGHKISLKTAIEITKLCLENHKLPEPVHLAHNYVNKVRKDILKKNPELAKEMNSSQISQSTSKEEDDIEKSA